MNKIVLQFWEDSIRSVGQRPGGCSVHIDIAERQKYIESIYSQRKGNSVPEEYENIIGGPIIAFVEDSLFNLVLQDKSVRIAQYQLNNLKKLDEIIIKEEI